MWKENRKILSLLLLFLTKTSKTCQIVLTCFSRVWVKIRILSRYTTTIHSVIQSQKMSFIIVWKVAELLVIPKNIMRGSKRPLLVQKAAFYSFPDLIQILLNYHILSIIHTFPLFWYRSYSILIAYQSED